MKMIWIGEENSIYISKCKQSMVSKSYGLYINGTSICFIWIDFCSSRLRRERRSDEQLRIETKCNKSKAEKEGNEPHDHNPQAVAHLD